MQEIVNVNIPSLNDLLLVPGVVPLQIGEKEYYNSKEYEDDRRDEYHDSLKYNRQDDSD